MSGNHDFSCPFFIKVILLHEFLIIGNGKKFLFIIRITDSGMIKHIARSFYRIFHFGYSRSLSVNGFTDIVQHIAVVGLSAVAQIAAYEILLYTVEVADVIGRVGSHRGVYGDTLICCLLYLLTLFFDNAQSHAIDEYHVITGQTIEVVKRHFAEFDE